MKGRRSLTAWTTGWFTATASSVAAPAHSEAATSRGDPLRRATQNPASSSSANSAMP